MDPVRGNNTKNCLDSSSPDHPCKNLSYAFQQQYRNSSTHYFLQNGTHYLNSTASDHPFTGLTNIAITGNASGNSSVRILCFTENAGLSFLGMINVTLGNLTLTNCSSQQNGTSWNVFNTSDFELLFVHTALYFSHCTNISMNYVIVSNSSNASAVTVYNTVGTNTFTHCEFRNNYVPVNSSLSGGGGVHVEFSYCIPGNTSCQSGKEPSYVSSNTDSQYTFTDCNFTNNSAEVTKKQNPLNIFPNKQNRSSFGQGGGLMIIMCGTASRNSFVINNCIFSNNTAILGGGLFVEYADMSKSNNVTVIQTSFINNTCTDGRGGGAYIGHFLLHNQQQSTEDKLEFINCTFSENEAYKGAGLRIAISYHGNMLFNALLSGVTFRFNRAKNGGAALMAQMTSSSSGGQTLPLFIQNCHFTQNAARPDAYNGPKEEGMGVVYVEAVDVQFEGLMSFEENRYSALALVDSRANIANTTMIFNDNTAVNGGALTLLGSARLVINQNTFMIFDSNRAYSLGGAIFNKYTDSNTYRYITNCFIVHEDNILDPDQWGAQFTFSDNCDSVGKNAIYSTSVLPCGSSQSQNLSSVFCWKNWTYQYNGQESHNCSEYIHTAPGNIVINSSTHSDHVLIVEAYPGEVRDIPIFIFDDLHHNTKAVFSAVGRDNRSSLDPDYSYIPGNKIRALGNPNSSLQVELNSIGDRNWHVRFFVNLTECPPGLMLLTKTVEFNIRNNFSYEGRGECKDEEFSFGVSNGSTSACVCNSPSGTVQIIRCNNDTSASLLNGHWMGKHRIGKWHGYVVSPCPLGFCRTGTYAYIPLPKHPEKLEKHICGIHHRKGMVCGKCVDGYGQVVYMGSFQCVSCNISSQVLALHVFYYTLSVYIPLFLSFLIIIVFNIKLTTGPANAFILFSQVISSTLNINADRRIPLNSISTHIDSLLKAYIFPYGIFNLQFFELFVPQKHLCFGVHLSALDLLLLEYLVALSPLLMILAIVGVYRFSGRCNCLFRLCCSCKCPSISTKICVDSSHRLRKSTVPAIASFILLSYTKFSLTSSLLLTPTRLTTISGKHGTTMYFYYAGHEEFSNPENILHYILPATIVTMTFVVIPPLLLLDYPLRLLERILRLCPLLWRLYPSGKIHIMLDAFQGCYKDRYRWFAGLYFIFRLLINVTNALTEDLTQFFLQGFYCYMFIVLVLILRPYRRQFYLLNYVDGFIFVNMAVINHITLFLYQDTQRGENLLVLLFSVQYILVFLPLVYMVAYVIWSVLPIPQVRARVREWLETRQCTQQMENLIENKETSETPDDVDWERAKAINCYKPVSSPESPLYFSISRPTHHTKIDSLTDHQPLKMGRSSEKDYGSTGRSDSGITTRSLSSSDSTSEQAQ